jgi:ATP-dependent helicase/nuclease subunit A
MTRPPRFPHCVIRASAGTGKTYQLAVRFIGLLAAGARGEEILATTFTRKAAGEILERVLFWLAQASADDRERVQLARAIGAAELSAARCRELLTATVRKLHRLRVGTLDSYFIQVASSFGQELGLPPGWRICDEQLDARLRDEAIDLVLAQGRLSDLLTLVHSLTKGTAARGIAQLIRDTAGGLFELYRETTPAAWQQIAVRPELPRETLERTLEALAELPLANKRMATARGEDIARVRGAAWEEFVSKGLAAKVLSGECAYYSAPLPPELVALYRLLLQQAEAILIGQLARQTTATQQLLARFAEQYQAVQHDERALRFSDVTFRLASGAETISPDRLAFRLDGGIRHVLLDEFQDTAPAQWRVLRPLASSVTARPGGSFFCVGDAKQAIYGWRGGVAELFDALGSELRGLEESSLSHSYRSSPQVIDVVNQVFQNLTRHPHLDKLSEPVAAWQAAFPAHSTARTELTGHVTLSTAPAAGDDEHQADVVYRTAAQRIGDLVQAAPRCSVGVLVRTNTAVARLIYLLRAAGIPASEEGGNPLIDSPAVELLLSLLRLADHPGDRVARFHLAASPLAEPLAFDDHRDDRSAARLGQQLRRQLLEEGYGGTVAAWASRLAPSCAQRDLNRLQQVVELAYGYQPQSSLRTDDFIRLVQTKRIADPTSADVRVMTIHQAKGLQFDAVFLPELEGRLVGQPEQFVAGRPSPTQPVDVVCRLTNEQIRQFLPAPLQALFESDLRREVTESLCVLYVALTRAIHALHLIIAPARPNERSLPKTFAGILRATLAAGRPAIGGETLFELGDREWRQSLDSASVPSDGTRSVPAPWGERRIQLAPPPLRRLRGLERTSPSALEGGDRVAAATALAPRSSAGFGVGTLIHAWMEQIEWLDAGPPSADALRNVAARLKSQIGEIADDFERHHARFLEQLAAPAVAAVLSRPFYADLVPGGSELSVQRERPFAIRHGDELLSGSIDRLVILHRRGVPIAADVVDFKTDELARGDSAALKQKTDFYRPQLDAYRAAAARFLRLPANRVSARLVFLSVGLVQDLPPAD